MANVWLFAPDHMESAGLDFVFGTQRQSGVTVSTANPRYGTSYLQTGSSNNVAEKEFTGMSEFYMGMAVRVPAARTLWEMREGGTIHLAVRVNATGNIEVVRSGSTVIATGTATLSFNSWYFVELYALIADSGGRAVVRVGQPASGSPVNDVDFTGDTRNGGTGVFSRLRITGNSVSRTDFYVNDTSGSVNNSWWGDMAVACLRPDGAGNSTQFTPSAGSNWQNVDDTAQNGDTDFNSSGTAGDKDLYTMSDLPSGASAVLAVRVEMAARKDDAGARAGRTVIRTGATDYEGSDIALPDTYAFHGTTYDVSPNTGSAWTVANVNALEAGAKVQS